MPRSHRRGDRADPGGPGREGGPDRAGAALPAERAAVQGDRRPAPGPPDPPGGGQDPGGVRGPHQGDRPLRGHPRQPPPGGPAHQGRAGRAAQALRRPPAHRDPIRGRRSQRGGPDPQGAGLRHPDPPRLHQAHPGGQLPGPAPRRPWGGRGQALHRTGLRRALHDGLDPQRHALLHQPGEGLPAANPRDPGRQAPGQGAPGHQPHRDRPGRADHRPDRRRRLLRRAVPGDGDPAGPDQEDPVSRLLRGAAQWADRHQPPGGRRAGLGEDLDGR